MFKLNAAAFAKSILQRLKADSPVRNKRVTITAVKKTLGE